MFRDDVVDWDVSEGECGLSDGEIEESEVEQLCFILSLPVNKSKQSKIALKYVKKLLSCRKQDIVFIIEPLLNMFEKRLLFPFELVPLAYTGKKDVYFVLEYEN